MASATIINAAPMTRTWGTLDSSTRAPVREPQALPTHLAKVFAFTERGPTTPQLVVGGSRSVVFGEKSFDLRQKWATHTTVLSNILNAQGNAQMLQRLEPPDAGPPASLRLYLDVLETQVPVYERNVDGSIKVDEDGDPISTGNTVEGFSVKWVVEAVKPNPQTGEDTFGVATIMPGDQVDGATQSERFPIMDLRVTSFGAYGNNIAFRMWAPTLKSNTPVDERLIREMGIYPYRFGVLERPEKGETARPVTTNYGEQSVLLTFRPKTVNRYTDQRMYVGEFLDRYQDLDTPGMAPKFGPFGKMAIYQENIDRLLKQFTEKELDYIDNFSDFVPGETADEQYNRFNFVSGVSSQNVPYVTYQLVNDAANATLFTETSSRYATGGSDGTMTNEVLNKLVAAELREYANPDSRLMDLARNPESIFYDSGFSLETKYAIPSFIAIRKDTFAVLSTFDVDGVTLTASEDSSLAVALRTRLQFYPESDYFGTAAMRGMIIGRSGVLINSQWSDRLPLTLEIAHKSARYMGAGNGVWTNGQDFDAAPGSVIELFKNISETFTPATVRNRDWDAGLVWPQSYDMYQSFFPALKTIYDNDTSVLTNYFTVMCAVELQKVGERAWREFSGSANLTNLQLNERVEEFVRVNTTNRFDNRFIIIPEAYETDDDLQRGFSWTLRIRMAAPNMKTVQTLYVEAERIDDLEVQQ